MTLRLVALLALPYLTAFGQDAGGFHGSMRFSGFRRYAPPVTSEPYCGEVVTGHVQTLADGTHLTSQPRTAKVCRDSMARTREDRSATPGAAPIVEIIDPVAHTGYVLDTQAKVAHKLAMPPPEHSAAAPAAEPKAPQTATEKLGLGTIEGVKVEGTRRTTTWPEGSSLGNDRPVVFVYERWQSPELKIPLLIKEHNPRSGDRTEKMTNLIRGEPDSSLFQPPPDYTIVEEREEFSIKW